MRACIRMHVISGNFTTLASLPHARTLDCTDGRMSSLSVGGRKVYFTLLALVATVCRRVYARVPVCSSYCLLSILLSALLSALGGFLINSQQDPGVISCPRCLDRPSGESERELGRIYMTKTPQKDFLEASMLCGKKYVGI